MIDQDRIDEGGNVLVGICIGALVSIPIWWGLYRLGALVFHLLQKVAPR